VRDAAEHERLDAQARFWSADAAALFVQAGIARGWHVADLGCGTWHVPQLLAARVGPQGSVRAIDNDAALVARAGSQTLPQGCGPVRAEAGDAYATRWPGASLDAAHARFLAAPAGRLHTLLAEMARIVRPGGCVLLQEPDSRTWELPGTGDAWKRLREFIRIGFELRGGNFDAGCSLAAAMASAGIEDVQQRRVVRTIDAGHPYSTLPLAFARQLRPLWLAEGVLRDDELDALIEQVTRELAAGGTVQTFTLVQAWGWRAG
jgi:SAM-dependent methyltransferase